ncbi:MAG: prolipoprotein diacylglyceryl transferase [Patescibacteria group bacterium]
MFLHTFHPQAIALTIGEVSVHWYGISIATAVAIGLITTLYTFTKKQVDTTHVYNLFFLILFFGLFGGRIGHVIGEWSYYHDHTAELASIWHGGLAIHGVLAGALVAVWIYARVKRLSFWLLTDLMVVALPVMQAVGRWGNYFNQELYGRPTSSGWGIPIDPAFREPGYESYAFFHPLFLYESGLMLMVFGLMAWLFFKAKIRPGALTAIYFVLFSIVRFMLDYIRLHKPMLGVLSETQWLSLVIFFLAVFGLWRLYRQPTTA